MPGFYNYNVLYCIVLYLDFFGYRFGLRLDLVIDSGFVLTKLWGYKLNLKI